MLDRDEQSPSYEWSELGSESYYHKYELYKLSWDNIDLSEFIFAAAPYGGAIAITRDQERFQQYRGKSNQHGSVIVYNSIGEVLRDLRWENEFIRSLGWTEDEHLIVVARSGLVRYYDLLGNFSQFTLSKSTSTDIIDCRYWSHGMIARTASNELIRVDDFVEPRPQVMVNTHITSESIIHSWTLVPPAFTLSRKAECMVAVDSTVIVLDGSDSQDMSLEHGPFTHLEVSPNGQFLALRSTDGKILVASTDFQRTLTEYEAGDDYNPSQIAWCGNDAVVAVSDTFMTVIGPVGDTLQFAFESAVKMATDVDGLRMFSTTECEYLRKVPDTSERIFAPGSTSAASVLLDAIEQLDAKSSKADENIRLIEPYLAEAVDDCIRAAGESFSSYWQKQLLKAASFGKGFLGLYNSDEFVDMCESLRVMNAVRHTVGIPLTLEQYIRLTPEGLIARLLQRKHHYLASRICDYLSIPSDHVYVHWACLKLQNSNEDAQTTCSAIVKKLGPRKQISYEKIARTAFLDGRMDLATQLLPHEPRSGAQVPLLLDMGELESALDKAISSGDPDLLMHVVIDLKSRVALPDFFKYINNRPAASAVLIDYARDFDTQLLKDYYYQDDRKLDSAMLALPESPALAAKMLKEGKEYAFESRVLDEHVKLVQVQAALTKDLGVEYTGSIIDTIQHLHETGHPTRAQRIATQFKVPDQTIAWVLLQMYIKKRDWIGLEKWLMKGKKPAISFEKVAVHVYKAGNATLARQLLSKCSDQVREETQLQFD